MAATLSSLTPIFVSVALGSFLQKISAIRPQDTAAIEDLYETLGLANQYTVALYDELLAASKYLRQVYARRFPELETFDLGPVEYAKAVLAICTAEDLGAVNLEGILKQAAAMVIAMAATTTTGRLLTDDEYSNVRQAAETVLKIEETRLELFGYVEGRMNLLAPNLSAIVGTTVASQLITTAGGIRQLSEMPAGNLQILGRSRKNLAGFSLASVGAHVGYIADSDIVKRAPAALKTKAQRIVAAKCTIASRVDRFREAKDGSKGTGLRREIEEKLEKLAEPSVLRPEKPLPPPGEVRKKRRGGKRQRKLKEQYAQTELYKRQNCLAFGQAEEEIIVGSTIMGLGMASGAGRASAEMMGGKIRAAPIDGRGRELLKKQAKKSMPRPFATPLSASMIPQFGSRPSGNAGAATSISFTPVQGIELGTGPSIVSKQKTERYFSASAGFRPAAGST